MALAFQFLQFLMTRHSFSIFRNFSTKMILKIGKITPSALQLHIRDQLDSFLNTAHIQDWEWRCVLVLFIGSDPSLHSLHFPPWRVWQKLLKTRERKELKLDLACTLILKTYFQPPSSKSSNFSSFRSQINGKSLARTYKKQRC